MMAERRRYLRAGELRQILATNTISRRRALALNHKELEFA